MGAALFVCYVLMLHGSVRAALYKNKLSICEHPLPDESFPHTRCIPDTCYWCDEMQKHIASDPQPLHPYRSPAQESR